ncbi:hypothetical protein GHT06_017014 [Daphnia sinensis]|uniref:Uncharacterized protein n=1 Tax=Daphnia sinensis TaxID=1820382 RepID=A0AAD5KQ98_9CRUS|nr:hypothetical protein GHT06_017014 [Daphnia sinensis]
MKESEESKSRDFKAAENGRKRNTKISRNAERLEDGQLTISEFLETTRKTLHIQIPEANENGEQLDEGVLSDGSLPEVPQRRQTFPTRVHMPYNHQRPMERNESAEARRNRGELRPETPPGRPESPLLPPEFPPTSPERPFVRPESQPSRRESLSSRRESLPLRRESPPSLPKSPAPLPESSPVRNESPLVHPESASV